MVVHYPPEGRNLANRLNVNRGNFPNHEDAYAGLTDTYGSAILEMSCNVQIRASDRKMHPKKAAEVD